MKPPVHGTPRLMRAINDRAALRILLEKGPLTRPELSRLTGLSKPTAFQLLARLQEAGLVVNDGVRTGQAGRTAEVYRVNGAAAYVAALDVTPGRIGVRVADITGAVVGEADYPAPFPEPSPASSPAPFPASSPVQLSEGGGLVERLRAAVEAARPPGPLRRVVIGVQGAVDPTTGRLDHAAAEDMPGWQIPDLVPTLTAGLGVTVDVENDVNLAALAEQAHGAAAGCPDFVLLWAGEGLGAALVIGGRLHRGFFGGAGEVGYMPIPGAATARDGGRFGHHGYQALAGGPALQDLLRSYGVRGADFRESVATAARLAQGTGRAAQEAAAGLRTVASRVALGLATIAAVVDPGLVVLAGGLMSAGGEPLRDLVERELRVLDVDRPQVRLSAVDGNPVLVGGLDLALARVRDEVFGHARDGAPAESGR
ncbi:ROK family transcriptional regulator [Nonomuraea sp. C10]|uniref:ROK family transcriptional regulator n=1 Tax=Nonomuraea sp. C10 TaxID=2600577 RepID=UPI001C9D58E2|nr:ROK family transcriptional regulator [Nonomuraea sp. C10]